MSVSKLSESSGWGDNSSTLLQKLPFQIWFPQGREDRQKARTRAMRQFSRTKLMARARRQSEKMHGVGAKPKPSALPGSMQRPWWWREKRTGSHPGDSPS